QRLHTKESALDGDGRGKWTIVQDGRRSAGASVDRPAVAGKNSTRRHEATETNGSQFDGWPGNSRAHGRIERSATMSLYGSRFDSFSRIVRSVRGAARRPSNWMVSSVV